MKIIKGDLILKKDTTFNEDLKVEGNIKGYYNLIVKGNLICGNLNCWDLDCRNLNCWDLNCLDLNCLDLDCGDLNCGNLNCRDLICGNLNCKNLNFYAVAITYKSFKCKSWKAERGNYIIKCLDGDIELKEK